MIAKDFPGTIKQLADAGFQTIELCSPMSYAEYGFGGLSKYKGAELRRILGDAGVSCVSSHFGIAELRKNQAGAIAWAKDVGLTQMIVPSLDGPEKPILDEVKRAAEEYNKMGEQSAKAGIQQGLHNEGFELSMVDGKRTYDLLLDLLDPKRVKFLQGLLARVVESLFRGITSGRTVIRGEIGNKLDHVYCSVI